MFVFAVFCLRDWWLGNSAQLIQLPLHTRGTSLSLGLTAIRPVTQEGGFLAENWFLSTNRAAVSRCSRLSDFTCHLILHGFLPVAELTLEFSWAKILSSKVQLLWLCSAELFLIATNRISVILGLHVHQRGFMTYGNFSWTTATFFFWVLIFPLFRRLGGAKWFGLSMLSTAELVLVKRVRVSTLA